MTPSEIFSICNLIVMPMWVLLIFLPKWKATRFLIDYKIVPILLSLVYAVYIGISLATGGMMDFGSLKSVMALFTVENAVLAGWVHYLAFDLLVGMWMLDQNKNIGIHPILMAPCLFLTFMFGPIGFLLFTIIKSIKK
ncbi:MAG: DUF4281 domain-containing protein [Allomuricauda sp.]|nr:MAG: DUF4281 domain-containing protein [Allomuricauda sp.]